MRGAGRRVMALYDGGKDIPIWKKQDHSPLTAADIQANDLIIEGLQHHYPDIPILSEESPRPSYEERKHWNTLFLIDPLDGTKEFIAKNGEFTINIAYIENQIPQIGVIYAPAHEKLYYAQRGQGAYLELGGGKKR